MKDSNENRSILAQVFARCWSDENYKKIFLNDPKVLLVEAGFDFETFENIKVSENTEAYSYVVLPEVITTEFGQMLGEKFAAQGDEIQSEFEIRFVKNSSKLKHLVLPQKPASIKKELSENDLAQAAGGGDILITLAGGGDFLIVVETISTSAASSAFGIAQITF